MRQVITQGVAIALLFFVSFSLRAGENKLTAETGVENTSESIELSDQSRKGTISKWVNNFVYQGEELLPHTSLQASLTQECPDYSHVILTNNQGNEYALSDQTGKRKKEYKTSTTATYAVGSDGVTLGGDTSISKSPYRSQGLKMSYFHDFKLQGNKVEMGYSYRRKDQPESYYFPDLTSPLTTRPSKVRQRLFYGSTEQIITDRLKTKILLSHQIKSEERPSNTKVSSQWAYAIGGIENLYGQVGYTYAQEDKKTPIAINQKGYLKAHTLSMALTYEPIYDLLITASYDLIIEDEHNNHTGAVNRVGVDQYGLGARYEWTSSLSTSARGSSIKTNQNSHALNLLGGIEWAI